MSRSSRRHAVTLIELLVVIAIITLLIGLLLPAVQSVRAAVARAKCHNNLKQIGLALHQYHDVQETLPPGCSYRNGFDPQPHMSWLTRLLPYLEQQVLWQHALQAFNQDKFFESPPHLAILRQVMPGFLCPADGTSPQTWDFGSLQVAYTHYLGVGGTDYSRLDGVLYVDSSVRLTDIQDGTSNTLAVGERPPGADHVLGWWYAGWGQSKDGSAEMVLGVREMNVYRKYSSICPHGPYQFVAGKAGYKCDVFHFWSWHGGGANFAFADGSVRFLRYSANDIMPALASRAGGEVVVVPD